jgi:hypothetical protein
MIDIAQASEFMPEEQPVYSQTVMLPKNRYFFFLGLEPRATALNKGYAKVCHSDS